MHAFKPPIQFPRHLITNFGTGEIGPVTLTTTTKGIITSASATLYDAPFKAMRITSPRLLVMFSTDSHEVDVRKVTPNGHPCPQFRLVESEPENFDVGILTLCEYVRDGAWPGGIRVFGMRQNEVSRDMYETVEVEDDIPAPKDKVESVSARTANTSGPPSHTSSLPLDDSSQTLENSSQTLENSSPGSTNSDGVSIAELKKQHDAILAQILTHLNAEDQELYTKYITKGPSRCLKEGLVWRFRLRNDIMGLINKYVGEDPEVGSLHNQLARVQHGTVKKLSAHLPIYEKEGDAT